MDEELEPCPFCGSRKVSQEYTSILCPDCGAIGPDKHIDGECVDPYVVWNKRNSPWISVEDRLPERLKVVLAKSSNGIADLYVHDGEWFNAPVHFTRITHWMEIPG